MMNAGKILKLYPEVFWQIHGWGRQAEKNIASKAKRKPPVVVVPINVQGCTGR